MSDVRPRVIPVFLYQLDQLQEVVEAHLARGRRDSGEAPTEVAFYGGSFPALGADERQRVYRLMARLAKQGVIDGGLRVTADPADVLPDIPSELAHGGVRTTELNVCSMCDDTLEQARRRHTVADAIQGVSWLKEAGLRVGVRIHPGLPGSSTQEIEDTGRQILALKPDFVRIYPVLVLAGSWLEEMMDAGQYHPLTLDEAVAACKSLLAMCDEAGVSVARMGLQPAVDLAEGGRVVAGPYHPSLRYLVDAALMYDRANDLLAREFRFAREVILWVSPKDEASLIGHEGGNLRKLKERFRLREIRINTDPELPRRTVKLEIPGTPGQMAS